MLGSAKLVAFGAITDVARARAFYEETLGLEFRTDTGFSLVMVAGGVEIFLQKVEQFTPHPFTSMGWQVDDANRVVDALAVQGVTMERFPWFEQDERGIWVAPGGARVAWFKDPDGNLLSVAQYPS